MVATPKTGVCDSYYAVSLEMKHIMARITLNISKDASYEGLGKLSQITLESDGITQSGTMNAKDGSLWWESSSDVIFPELKTTLSSKVTVQECLVIPTGYSAAKQNLTVRCVVDGQEYNTAFLGENGIVISAGTHSTINLTLSKI